MERGGGQQVGVSGRATGEHKDPAWQLRKYLLLLAILVATVSYITGLEPPGGVWLETKGGHLTGNPILPNTRHIRYTLFYYVNATAFTASLVLILLLLLLNKALLDAVRGFMVLELLCLMVAYVAGSCRGVVTTVYASLLSAAVFAYVVAHTLLPLKPLEAVVAKPHGNGKLRLKEQRKVLMLLAIFVTTITYTAGLSPPGGFWEHGQEGQDGSRAGDPILLEGHSRRFVAFFVCNTTAFVASVAIIMQLLSSRLQKDTVRLSALSVCIAVALLGLIGAYTAGSSRQTHTTVYVLCLVGAVIVYISIVAVIEFLHKEGASDCCRVAMTESASMATSGEASPLDKARSLILLLATLAATVTYQAGLDPPGGVWRDDKEGHHGGDLILLVTNEWRYKVFFYCNSAAFVTSVIVILMVQTRSLLNRHALEAAVILDLFGLMGAYAAGSCRDVRSSIYVFALAAVMFVFMVIHVLVQKSAGSPPTNGGGDSPTARKGKLDSEKTRKLLLLLAILAVTVTYHAGLTPPGGFWIEHADKAHHYGDPVLADNYPRRYKAFFYCNATSFMASVAVIVLLVNRNLSDLGKGFYSYRALYVYMAVGLLGLLGAFAAGTSRRVRTSIYVFALVGVALVFAVLHINVIHAKLEELFPFLRKTDEQANGDTRLKDSMDAKYIEGYRMRKYLMLLGILAASVTYEAGLDPPGGVWPDSHEGHSAGNPILRDSDGPRYRAFFYSNSTSFVASIVVIVLLLQGITLPGLKSPLRAMHAAVVLDLLGLVVAYAAGSSRDWATSGYVLAMAIAALAYLAIYVVLSHRRGDEARDAYWSSPPQQPSTLQELERPTRRQLDVVEAGPVELDVVEAGPVELDVVDVVEVPAAPLV